MNVAGCAPPTLYALRPRSLCKTRPRYHDLFSYFALRPRARVSRIFFQWDSLCKMSSRLCQRGFPRNVESRASIVATYSLNYYCPAHVN